MEAQREGAMALHGTTILLVCKGQEVVLAADGQVSLGASIMKHSATKIRLLLEGRILVGFAGSTADALTLFERLEKKVEQYPQQLSRACVELAKDWRTDRYLRRLEAMLIVASQKEHFVMTGNGDVLSPEDGLIGIGSGGNYALAAAKALSDSNKSAEEVARIAMRIAASMCVYTNDHLVLEKVRT